MSKGGMQTSSITSQMCKCGKDTSKTLQFSDGTEISIHFTRKTTYWHITKADVTKRVFKQPLLWM